MKKWMLLSCTMCTMAFVACHQVTEDTEPPFAFWDEPGFEFKHIVYQSEEVPTYINTSAIFDKVSSQDLVIDNVSNSLDIEVVNENYLKVNPISKDQEVLLLSSPNDANQIIPIAIRNSPPPSCIVTEDNPVYLTIPLSISVPKGQSHTLEIKDFLFCLNERPWSLAIHEYPLLDLDDSHMEMYGSTSWMYAEYTPPTDFVGSQGLIYQLCYELPEECLDQRGSIHPPAPCDLTQCGYFIELAIIFNSVEN